MGWGGGGLDYPSCKYVSNCIDKKDAKYVKINSAWKKERIFGN